MTEQLVLPLVLVETSDDLPPSDQSWTVQPLLRFGALQEGAGTLAGSAVIEQIFGLIRPQYRDRYENIGVVPDTAKTGAGSLAGQFVRLLVQDPAGPITRGSGIYRSTYSAQWWGQITGPRVATDGAPAPLTGGSAAWQCAGILSILDQVSLDRGWVQTYDSDVADPGFLPAFNRLPGGDRSNSTHTVNGATVYVHDLSSGSSGNKWTAKQICDLLLAGASRPFLYYEPKGPQWVISDPTNCLAYPAPMIDLAQQTVAQALLQLISADRGLIHWETVAGSVVTIHVRSTVPTAIATPGYTLPASTKTTTIDQADGPFLRSLVVEERHESVYDHIALIGSQPWVACTLWFQHNPIPAPPPGAMSLAKGWDVSTESAWDANPAWSTTHNVWRRFIVHGEWNGLQPNDEPGLRNFAARSPNGDPTYGFGGFTGARSATALLVPASSLELTADLPVSDGYSTLATGVRNKAVIIVSNGVFFEDMSDRWRVSTLRDPAAMLIDDGAHGTEIASWLSTDDVKLFVTIGLRELMPLRVSWVRPQPLPRSTPRTLTIAVAAEQWLALGSSWRGVEIDGSAPLVASLTTVRDDTFVMQAQLALERARYQTPDIEISLSREGIDIGDAWRPGTLITTVDRGDRLQIVNAVIVSRSVTKIPRDRDTASYQTTYRATRVLPGNILLA